MTWCSSCDDDDDDYHRRIERDESQSTVLIACRACPSCGHRIHVDDQSCMDVQAAGSAIQDLPGLPAGVKFDPTDPELLEHLEGKTRPDLEKLHPLVDEFIPTIDGENGICYTHPEKLPGASRDGPIRHFFHRPSKAYTTGTRKRRKVHTDEHGGETRWHKTGKTRPVIVSGEVKGYKKILVLYTNYGKQRKPEKTNWVMHQYHLGADEEEKDGELVVSKIFYQTQPRQCATARDAVQMKSRDVNEHDSLILKDADIVDYYNSSLISYNQGGRHRAGSPHLIPNFAVHANGSSFLH